MVSFSRSCNVCSKTFFYCFLLSFFRKTKMSCGKPLTVELPPIYCVPQKEEYRVGLPFWSVVSKKYKCLADVPVGEKGYFVVGCEPGSGPMPFIVVFNDGHQIGLIHPYVTVCDRTTPKSSLYCIETSGSFAFPNDAQPLSDIQHVTVQLHGDRFGDRDRVKSRLDTYPVTYSTYDEFHDDARVCCFSYEFGSFGNCALPNSCDDFIPEWPEMTACDY